MAGILGPAVAFAFMIVFAVSLDPEPPEFLGPYTNDSSRWPFGGCAEVSKIYPAPGRKLLPPKTYEENWNVRVTVVFSRPVTRVLWPFDDRAWIHSKFLSTTRQEFERLDAWNNSGLLRDDMPNLVRCAKWACLVAIHGEWIQFWKASVAPTERGNTFNDEYEFSFSLPKSLEDRVSHFYFILDGGWFYAPVYKFSTRANVEYVPYTMVKYFSSSGSIFLANTQTVRESDYFLGTQTTCSARGGLIHHPFAFRRVKYDNRRENEDGPKLLPKHKIIESSQDGLLQIKKLRLYYQVRHPGEYTLHLPSSLKMMHQGKNFTVSLPFNTLNINFTVPRLYIPVDTRYIFDYYDRAYAMAPQWTAYFFLWSHLKHHIAQCNDSNLFECKNFAYTFSHHSPRTHLVATRRKFTSFHRINQRQINLYKYHTAFLNYYDNHTQPYQYFKNCSSTDEWYHVFEACVRQNGIDNIRACFTKPTGDGNRAQIKRLIIDPMWSMVATFDNQTMMLVDLITKSIELPKTLFGTFHIDARHLHGMMQYARTGSVYERDWSQAIPMINFTDSFRSITDNLLEGVKACTCHYRGFSGRWGTHRKITELANLYRLHVPLDVGAWSVQQTPNVTYVDKYGHKVSLKSDINIPDHIKKAVLKYVVLTNVEPNVHLGGNDDLPTRMKAEEESYPLEKAVFVPRELLDKYGCGQLYIRWPHEREHDQAHEQCADQCDDMYDFCSGLPFDSLERFPSMSPFNIQDLVGSTYPNNQYEDGHKFKRALYYSQRNNSWNHFILYSPNSYYTASIDVEGDINIEEPLYIEESCEEIWKFIPDKYEITKGYLIAMITNKGKGGNEISVSVSCSPKLAIIPNRVTVYTKPGQTTSVKFVLGGYLLLDEPGYQCETSIVIDTSLFPTAVGKGVITCSLLVPIINGAFTDPCNNNTSGVSDITYYVLPKDFVDQFSLQFFLSSAVGQHLTFYKLINVQLVKYHMISLSCENSDVIILPEDHLLDATRSREAAITTNRTLHLIYTTDEMLHRRLYVFVRKGSYQAGSASGAAMKCLLTLWSSPHRSCGIAARRYITLTEADVLLAKALEGQEAIKNGTSPKETSLLSDLISENDEVVSAVLVCMGTSLILIMVTISGNSLMFLYTKLSPTERKAQQIKTNLMTAKREHKKTWNNPQMYLRSGALGPYYMLHNFKATDELDNANLKTLKVAGMLKYKEKKLQVMFGHVKKIIIKQTDDTIEPEEVWLQASSGMYLLKQKHVSEEYREEFHSLLQRHTKTDN